MKRSINELENKTNLINDKNKETEIYYTHYMSYIIIFIYCIESYFMGTFLTSFGACYDIFYKVYNVESSKVSLTASVLSISFAISSIPLTYFSISKGLRFSLITGIIFFFIGNILRLFINYSFNIFIIGYIFLGMGSPLIMNSQLNLVNVWVHPLKRNVLNALISIVSPIGAGTAQILPLFFINLKESNIDILKSQISHFLWFYVIIMGIFLILNFIIIKDKPKKGYGKINLSENEINSNNLNFKKFIKEFFYALKQSKLTLSALIYGLGLTTISILGTSINPILEPFGLSKNKGILVCIICIFSGLIGAFIYSLIFQDKFLPKTSLHILYGIAMIGIVICPIGIIYEKIIILYLGAVLLGIGIFSPCSVIMEFCSKKYTKINAFAINSILILCQQFTQSIFIYIVGIILSNETKFSSLLCCLIIELIYLFIIIISHWIK